MHRQLSDTLSGLLGDHSSPGSRPSHRRGGLLAALVAGLVVLAASSAPTPPVAAAPAPDHGLPPIYALLDGRNDLDRRIDQAEHQLVTECMAEQGFQYTDAGAQAAVDDTDSGLRLFGLESLADLDLASPEEPVSQGEAYGRALFGDPDQQLVATGARIVVSRPATGCLAESENRLLGDLRPRRMQLRMQLFDAERDTREQLDNDPEFRTLNDRWRACMTSAGIEAQDPLRLLADLPEGADPRSHPAVQADLRCKAETNYLRSAYARLSVLQQSWLDDNPKVATEWTAIRHRQSAAAQRVLDS